MGIVIQIKARYKDEKFELKENEIKECLKGIFNIYYYKPTPQISFCDLEDYVISKSITYTNGWFFVELLDSLSEDTSNYLSSISKELILDFNINSTYNGDKQVNFIKDINIIRELDRNIITCEHIGIDPMCDVTVPCQCKSQIELNLTNKRVKKCTCGKQLYISKLEEPIKTEGYIVLYK